MIRCTKCGGTRVQYAAWVRPNKLYANPLSYDGTAVLDPFGDWKETDTKWCEDCEEHTTLRDESGQ